MERSRPRSSRSQEVSFSHWALLWAVALQFVWIVQIVETCSVIEIAAASDSVHGLRRCSCHFVKGQHIG